MYERLRMAVSEVKKYSVGRESGFGATRAIMALGALNPGQLKTPVYSYFEKGCRKKCMRQSRMVLWVVFISLFFKQI